MDPSTVTHPGTEVFRGDPSTTRTGELGCLKTTHQHIIQGCISVTLGMSCCRADTCGWGARPQKRRNAGGPLTISKAV
ncbi:unnamed protein product [Gadus morhua 'NCC']